MALPFNHKISGRATKVPRQSALALVGSIINWLPVFGNPIIAKIIINSLRFLHIENRMLLHAYVIMENYILLHHQQILLVGKLESH